MHAPQRVPRLVVIEARGGEAHDVGVAARVLGVAAPTVGGVDLTVVPSPSGDARP